MAKSTTIFTDSSKNLTDFTAKLSSGYTYGSFKYGAKKYSDSRIKVASDFTQISKDSSDFTQPSYPFSTGYKYGSFKYGAQKYGVTAVIYKKQSTFTQLTKPTTAFTSVI